MSQSETYLAALEKIVDSAPANGEDCSYLIAKQALAQFPRSCRCGYKWLGANRICSKCHPAYGGQLMTFNTLDKHRYELIDEIEKRPSMTTIARIIREAQADWKRSNSGHYNPMLARVAQQIGKKVLVRELDVVAFEQECNSQ